MSFQETLEELWKALQDPHRDFQPFYWWGRLLGTLPWRPLVPWFGLGLIAGVSLTYWLQLRVLVEEQPFWHDATVAYLTIMTLYYYIWTMRTDPGHVEAIALKAPEDTTTSCTFHPSPYPSHCHRCPMTRPPRAHHCRICHRCIPHFDHHCAWLGRCIGYANYRSFVCLLLYVTMGCGYGATLLGPPFYATWKERWAEEGWQSLVTHTTTWADVRLAGQQPLPLTVWIDVVYPLVFAVGALMAIFAGTHVKYASLALTTLEYKTKPKGSSVVNPYDQGGAWNNLRQVFGDRWYWLLVPIPGMAPLPPPIVPKKMV